MCVTLKLGFCPCTSVPPSIWPARKWIMNSISDVCEGRLSLHHTCKCPWKYLVPLSRAINGTVQHVPRKHPNTSEMPISEVWNLTNAHFPFIQGYRTTLAWAWACSSDWPSSQPLDNKIPQWAPFSMRDVFSVRSLLEMLLISKI